MLGVFREVQYSTCKGFSIYHITRSLRNRTVFSGTWLSLDAKPIPFSWPFASWTYCVDTDTHLHTLTCIYVEGAKEAKPSQQT